MMASPARTPVRVQDPSLEFDQDPMYWNIEEVVFALCSSEGYLRSNFKEFADLPEWSSLETIIRDNLLNGYVLLTDISEDDLVRMGIKACGHRKFILKAIKKLQKLSPRYQQESKEEELCASSAAEPKPLMTPQDQQHWGNTVTENFSYSPVSYSHSTDKILVRPGTSIISLVTDAVSSNPGLKEDVFQEQDRPEQRLRPGEMYVVDASGKKRRKLQLIDTVPLVAKDPPQGGAEKTSNRLEDHAPAERPPPNAESRTPQSDVTLLDDNPPQQPSEVIPSFDKPSNPQPDLEHVVVAAAPGVDLKDNLSEDLEEGPDLVSRSKQDDLEQAGRLDEDSPHEDALPIRVHSISGSITVDDKGRKRLIPEDIPEVQPKYIYRRPSQTYLGSKALPVDSLFYGDTSFEANVVLSDPSEVVKSHPPGAIKSPIDSHWRSESQSSDWRLVHHDVAGDGQRIYVNSRMKFFFFSVSMLRARGDGRTAYGIKPYPERAMLLDHGKNRKLYGINPYPERVLKKHSSPSLTLISRSDHDFSVTRVKRSSWTNTPAESVLAHLGENEIRDWDYLEKWNLPVHDQTVLPRYGDSDSEDEEDAELLREMRKDKAKRPGRAETSTMASNLTPKEISDVIDESVGEAIEYWEAKRRPFLERKAQRIWVQASSNHTRGEEVLKISARVDRLERRLVGVKKEIKRLRWTKLKELRKQCKSMHETIYAREEARWTVDVLKLKSKPQKPTKSEPRDKGDALERVLQLTKPSEDEGQDDNEDASESSDDNMDDFIDDDDLTPEQIIDDGDLVNDINLESHINPDNSGVEETVVGRPAIDNDTIGPDHVGINGNIADPKPGDSPASEIMAFTSDKEQFNDDVSSLHESLHEGLISGTRRQSRVTKSNVIDLTQLSDLGDSREPQSPLGSDEPQGICTPPLDASDPFSRYRKNKPSQNVKVKLEFKPPPGIHSQTEDLESDELQSEQGRDRMSTEERVTSRQVTPRDQGLPGLWEFENIKKLSWEIISEKQDRKRLVVWVILHQSEEDRQKVLKATDLKTSAEIQPDIWRALKLLMKKNLSVVNDDPSGGGWTKVGVLYITWHHNKSFHGERGGVPISAIEATLKSDIDFEAFYIFLQEVFSRLEVAKSTTERVAFMSDSTSKGKPVKRMKRQRRLDADSEDDMTPLRKRKYVVPESQEGVQKRKNAQARFKERVERQELLRQHTKTDLGEDASLIVNGKTGDESIMINPKIGSRIMSYQLEGVQFMWGEIVANTAQEEGCLLAHAMGLGKTMQVVTLLVTIAEASSHPDEAIRNQIPEALRESRTLVLCPPGLLDNWYEQFEYWTPREAVAHLGGIFKIDPKWKPKERYRSILDWAEGGGVLLLGYTTFRSVILKDQRPKSDGRAQDLTDEEHKKLLDCLLNKANIAVADEAHAMKQKEAGITKASAQIRSRRRIALTGSPLANNLEEYYTLIDWIAPTYLGSSVEFRSRFAEPINAGMYADSSSGVQRHGLKMLTVLKAELDPKVHRRDISVIKQRLNGKTEFVLRMPLTQIQEQAYTLFVKHVQKENNLKETVARTLLWGWLAVLRLLCNHPKCFRDKLSEGDQIPKQKYVKKRSKSVTNNPTEAADVTIAPEDDDIILTKPISSLGIPRELVDQQLVLFRELGTNIDSINLAHKVQVLLGILRFSADVGDKVLVFSHSLPTLNYLEDLFKKNNTRYCRLDGSTNMSSRQQLTKDFNSKDISVFLVSTRAGGQGLNLQGANRVVIMDDQWNPMHEEQAIGRAYRIGQEKHVYVYRLIVGGTFEEALQDQSLFKLQLATRVVDRKNQKRHASKDARNYIFQPKHLEQKDLAVFKEKDTGVLDKILGTPEYASIVRSIDLTETFRQEIDEPLTAEEAKETEELIKEEQLRRSDPVAYELRKAQREKAADKSRYEDMARQQKELLAMSGPQPRHFNASGAAPVAKLDSGISKPTNVIAASQVVDLTVNELRLIASSTPVIKDPVPPVRRNSTNPSASIPPPASTPHGSSLTNTSSSASKAYDSNSNVPNLDPVLGGRTRIGEGSPSGSVGGMPLPNESKAATPIQHMRTNSDVTANSRTSTPSLSGLKRTNLNVSSTITNGRDGIRFESASLISAHLESQQELGLISITRPLEEVATSLAAAIERVAYRNASSDEGYYMELEAGRKKVTERKGKALQTFVNEATVKTARTPKPRHTETLNSLSTTPSRGEAGYASPTSILGRKPTHLPNVSPSTSMLGTARSRTSSRLADNESYHPPYPALVSMMQRESNQ